MRLGTGALIVLVIDRESKTEMISVTWKSTRTFLFRWLDTNTSFKLEVNR